MLQVFRHCCCPYGKPQTDTFKLKCPWWPYLDLHSTVFKLGSEARCQNMTCAYVHVSQPGVSGSSCLRSVHQTLYHDFLHSLGPKSISDPLNQFEPAQISGVRETVSSQGQSLNAFTLILTDVMLDSFKSLQIICAQKNLPESNLLYVNLKNWWDW